jgi:hypothetical protein
MQVDLNKAGTGMRDWSRIAAGIVSASLAGSLATAAASESGIDFANPEYALFTPLAVYLGWLGYRGFRPRLSLPSLVNDFGTGCLIAMSSLVGHALYLWAPVLLSFYPGHLTRNHRYLLCAVVASVMAFELGRRWISQEKRWAYVVLAGASVTLIAVRWYLQLL